MRLANLEPLFREYLLKNDYNVDIGVVTTDGVTLDMDKLSEFKIMEDGNANRVERAPFYHYEKPYIFLRDVDVEPIILESEEVFDKIEGWK